MAENPGGCIDASELFALMGTVNFCHEILAMNRPPRNFIS
jgi:hypothetical protein